MKKNKHNIESGSSIERSDERIKETQEVFTPPELVESMIDDNSSDERLLLFAFFFAKDSHETPILRPSLRGNNDLICVSFSSEVM